MATARPLSNCPFCNFEDADADFTLQHVNLVHPENQDAPYIVRLGQNATGLPPTNWEGSTDWVECPCGELCMLSDIQQHINFHEAEDTDFGDIDIRDVHLLASTRPSDRTTSLSSMASLAPRHNQSSESDTITSELFNQQDPNDILSGLKEQQIPPASDGMRLSSREPAEVEACGNTSSKVVRLGVCCLYLSCVAFLLIGDSVRRPGAAPL